VDSENLNKYAELFKTSESGEQGQFLASDPTFVTNDEALIKNLDLNFKVVYSGSEAATITAFQQATEQKTPLIGYFYEPQWFMSEVPLKKVALPAYKKGCDADAAKIACDYPVYDLDKIVSAKFAKSGSPAYDLVKKFHWTNDDQNTVAKYIAVDKMTPDAAAKKWVDANKDDPEALTTAEQLVRGGLKRAAADHTNFAKGFYERAQELNDPVHRQLERLDLLLRQLDVNLPPQTPFHADRRHPGDALQPGGEVVLGHLAERDAIEIALDADAHDRKRGRVELEDGRRVGVLRETAAHAVHPRAHFVGGFRQIRTPFEVQLNLTVTLGRG